MLKNISRILAVFGVLFILVIIYGLATDCPDIVGYHPKSQGCNLR